jgi:hypothetical protein
MASILQHQWKLYWRGNILYIEKCSNLQSFGVPQNETDLVLGTVGHYLQTANFKLYISAELTKFGMVPKKETVHCLKVKMSVIFAAILGAIFFWWMWTSG